MNKVSLAAIFDMDGVICDTNPYHSIAFRVFFSELGLFPTDSEFAEHMFGKSNSYILSHFMGRKIEGQELADLEFKKEALFRELYAPHVQPIDGLIPFMQELHQAGVAIGIATSAPMANLDLILSKLPEIKGMATSLMASEQVERHKPDPEVYLKSAQRLGVSPERCVVFEDSVSGIKAGLAANMQVVGVLSSHQPHELPPCALYIERYQELDIALFERLVGG